MNYIVFDLEATCWEGWDKSQNETIEIGAVKINEQLETVSEYEQFVKPLKHPKLSEFCKELTSIRQEDVQSAPYFQEAIRLFREWIGKESFVLCSWGFYDRIQLESDCEIHGIEESWISQHISLKHQHGKIRKLKRAVGMKAALNIEKLALDGTHHRGIDDARNIAKIFKKCYAKWEFDY